MGDGGCFVFQNASRQRLLLFFILFPYNTNCIAQRRHPKLPYFIQGFQFVMCSF